jgi:hypothetical protein
MTADMIRYRAYAAMPFALCSLGLHWLAMRVISLAMWIEGEE